YVGIEMCSGLRFVFTQHPIVEVEYSLFTPKGVGKMHVIANVGRYVVIVYRIAHKPVEPRVAIAEIFAAAEPAVRHVGEPVGYADADEHAIHLVRLVVLVGPPYAGAQALAGGGYPVFSVAVFLEIKPAVPRCPFGLNGITGIKYSKRIHLSF